VSELTDAVRAQAQDHPDKAAAALAVLYAQELDSAFPKAEALKDLGPGLLRVLEAMTLTSKARAAGGPTAPAGPPTPAAPSALEALRDQYGPAGQSGPASVDAAAT
jgi:hypothetical protein